MQYVALLRGINVGRAKRVAMADLRNLIRSLGFTDVRTLLNSGNAVFRGMKLSHAEVVTSLEEEIRNQFGFSVHVVVISGDELSEIIAENPLLNATDDPSKFLVAFMNDLDVLDMTRNLLRETWAPEAVAVGNKAAYLYCANGIIHSKLAVAFERYTKKRATTRNWSTVLKLQQIIEAGSTA